jgi:MFS family permease
MSANGVTSVAAVAAEPVHFRDLVSNGPFRKLWIAQICSQLAQNLTWITLGAYIASQTGKSTYVAIISVSALLAQTLLSGFAGVLVDRTSKRAVLIICNALRVMLTILLLLTTPLAIALQVAAIVALIFLINAVSQFFGPAEAATIPLLVEKRGLIAATALFSVTLNACQVVPIIGSLLLLDAIGIVPILMLTAGLYVVATLLVAWLPQRVAVSPPGSLTGPFHDVVERFVGDVREALHFLARDPGLRLTLIQVNVAPTFLLLFGTLGLTFVKHTFNVDPKRAWILLLPAGVGLLAGALGMGRVVAHRRKEGVINVGLVALGTGVAALGLLPQVFGTIYRTAGQAERLIARHVHAVRPIPAQLHNGGLIPPAMAIAAAIGVALALVTIPAQTLVLERTTEEVRGRVLSVQQMIGGAIPIIPLLIVAPLADLVGTATVLTGLGFVILLVGALSLLLDRRRRRAA